MWMTSCTGSARGEFWGFWRKSVSWVLQSEEEGWISLARSGLVAGATRVRWGRWKTPHRKIVLFSLYVEKPLSSKVIKSFVPEIRSRKCFSCFGIPMFYVYMLWTFYVRFTHIRIWLSYTGTKLYYLWVKGYSTWGERDTIFLCWLLLHRQLSTQPTRGARNAQIRLATPSSESRPSRLEAGTQLTDFFQISKSSAHTSGPEVIHIPRS